MANFRSVGAFLSGNNHVNNTPTRSEVDVVKKGVLVKKKNNKSRYFILRRETNEDLPSRLEIYESEQKYNAGSNPKKKYILKECFSISRKADYKDRHVIEILKKKDNVALVAPTEAEMLEWLNALQHHKNPSAAEADGSTRIEFEHVWPVEVQPRGLGSKQNLSGHQYACLTNRLLTLARIENANIKTEIPLCTIRKCGFVNQFFFVELGQRSPIGSGTLYMKIEDTFLAQNMNCIVGNAMNHRPRARSASDAHHDSSVNHLGTTPIETRSRATSFSTANDFAHFSSPVPLGSPSSSDCVVVGSSSDEEQDVQHPSSNLDLDSYVEMDPINDHESTHLPLRSNITDFRNSFISEDNSEYVPMGELEDHRNFSNAHPPNSLFGLSPNINENVSGISTRSCNTPQGTSTPVSPSGGSQFWASHFRNQMPSPHGSSGSHSAAHSRSSSLIDDTCDSYIPMLPPVSSLNSLSPAPPHSSYSPNNYLEMGPGPGQERRAASTPTPIPVSPSDCDSYHEMSPNSGSSSFTSGTPSSDQRIHEFIGDRTSSSAGGLGPNFSGGEDMDSLEIRPIRTNSVGSKPEQFKRKNRLDAVIIGEPARVRAFSVGSRVSLKFGRLGTSGGAHGCEPPASGLGELFPSIKECGKQAKSKSSSAPMLDVSPVSHSWSGTPGSYFRGILQNRNHREKNLMELDFSKNKSYDGIPSEEKEKERKTSKERLWHTFTGYRQRTNSKSSGGSNSRVTGGESSRIKKLSEGEICGRGVEIPSLPYDRNDYFEMDFNPSPRSTASDSSKGYLPMHPPSNAFASSLTNGTDCLSKRGPRHNSINDSYYEMSSSLSSCASQDGYVDMTQGGSTNALTIASSSSSTNSVNCSTSINRKLSNIFNPLSSQDLPSPMEDFMDMDLNMEGDLIRKKGKKGSKRKSFKDSTKRKKSDSGSLHGRSGEEDSPEFPQKSKAAGPFSALSNLITRKPSTSKAPLSPLGSPIPKSTKDSPSPFSSLKRTKSRDIADNIHFPEVNDLNDTTSLITDCHNRIGSLSSELSISSPTLEKSQLSGSLEMTTQFGINKGEEKMLLSPTNAGKLLRQTSKTSELNTEEKRMSAYVNLDLSDETTIGSLPSLHMFQRLSKPLVDNQSYMNMQPGSSSPQLSPPAKKEKPSPCIDEATSSSPPSTPLILNLLEINKGMQCQVECNYSAPHLVESNYMLMGNAEKESSVTPAPTAPSVTRRPHIPPKLLSSRPHPPSLGLEKLALNEQAAVGSTERSRSLSGPGASERGSRNKMSRNNSGNDDRAASACSSPVSYSPPTSPTLGSVSSMSSLSEGGLSSASSTCTVVNVGVQRQGCLSSSSKGSVVSQDQCSLTESLCPQKPVDSKSSYSLTTSSSGGDEDALNYACLDLGRTMDTSDSVSLLVPSNSGVVNKLSHDEKSNYVAINFAKSEQQITTPNPPH